VTAAHKDSDSYPAGEKMGASEWGVLDGNERIDVHATLAKSGAAAAA